jgi:hypothetical protein
VAYVAATRARDNLLVTTTKGRPSLFFEELLLDPAWRGKKIGEVERRLTACQRELRRADPARRAALEAEAAALTWELEMRRLTLNG